MPISPLPGVPVPVADAFALLTAVLACGMAVSNRLTKRLGAVASVLGAVAVVLAPVLALLMLELCVLALWLLGRGIPRLRPRSLAMRGLALLTALLALVATVQLLD